MPRLISASRDKRVAMFDVKGDRTERYDVYDYRSCIEYVVRNMHGYVHCSENTWQMVIIYGQKTAFKYDKRTGKYSATNENKSKKNWSNDNKKPDDWQPYAERLKEYLASGGEEE